MKKKKWWILGGILFLAIAAFIYWKKRPAEPSSALLYKKVVVKKGQLDIEILSTGTVQPENRVDIKAPIAGRVEKVLVVEGERVKKGQTLAWMSSTERAALMDAANAKGPEEVKVWEDLYKSTPILAPIDGTIIQRNIESGQTFATSDAILSMSDRLTVKAQVDETDIAQIKLKQSANIVLDAYPGNTIPATVDQIAYDAKTVNNVTTYLVDVLPIQPPKFMRSGMTANVTFSVNSKPDALLISVDAVKVKRGQSSVQVPAADGTNVLKVGENTVENSSERIIQTGLTDGRRIEVTVGLEEGDVIYTLDFKVDPNKKTLGTNPFSPTGPPRGLGGKH